MSQIRYPLLTNAFSENDLNEGIKVIKTGQITMSKITKNFEKKFAKFVGAKYALMVNSGSSANLLSVYAACNPYRKNKFKRGDEVIIPSLCWSTSLWPLVQAGLKPVFIDINPKTLNVDVEEVIKNITKKTKVIMAVHVLGGTTNMQKLVKVTKKKNIILIEDTCESLGSKYNNKFLGTIGDFGTYSFYYSHQISSGEGGMIVCNNYNDYSILHSLRSHGWTRNLKIEKKFENLDKRFIFYNMGFNLRPTDVSAAIGYSQFKRLKKFQQRRNLNRQKIINSIKASSNWKNQFSFQMIIDNCTPSWFGLPIFINEKYKKYKKKYIKFLEKSGIETRPIISGNFVNQPAIKKFKLNKENKKFPNAQKVEETGFFIGLHTNKISDQELNFLVDKLLKIENFK
jgi:CDP-6-deoxy-D-xylo-4-hexulose-3-dehydrase